MPQEAATNNTLNRDPAMYDPGAAICLWQKMNRLAHGSPPECLSTIPQQKHGNKT